MLVNKPGFGLEMKSSDGWPERLSTITPVKIELSTSRVSRARQLSYSSMYLAPDSVMINGAFGNLPVACCYSDLAGARAEPEPIALMRP